MEFNSIANLPFSDELKQKLFAYVESVKNKKNKQGGCAIIGCPDLLAKTLLTAIAYDLECRIAIRDARDVKTEADLAAILTNISKDGIVAFFHMEQIDPGISCILNESIIDSVLYFKVGKGRKKATVDIPLPNFNVIVCYEDKTNIPVDFLEWIYTIIDLSSFKAELRKEIVFSTFRKYGLSAREQIVNQIALSPYSNRELLSRVYEIRNKVLEVGGSEVTEDFISEKQANLPDIEMVDHMEGRSFELFTKDLFCRLGFKNVSVTPVSGDFGADVIAEKDNVRYAIQCKRYGAPVGVYAVQEVLASKSLHDCHVACVLTNNSFTPAAYELAKKNLVILWDRNKLQEFINRSNQ